MADNVAITAGTGTTVAADEIVDGTLGTVKVQYVKLMDGTLDSTTKIGGSNGLPISQNDSNTTGTITATDVLGGTPAGTGVLISTAPTANSFVAAAVPGGSAQADIQITGTATGTYYFEASMDSTTGSDGNWITVNYRQTGIINTVLGYSATAVGVYRGAPSGFKYIRVRNIGGTTPSNPVIIRYSNGSGTTFLNASIPAGSNSIGTIGNFNTATALPDNHAVPTTTEVGAIHELMNGIGNIEKAKAVTSSFNSGSTGIAASGVVAQLDDTATQAITEDQFGVVRMSTRRALLVEGVAGGTAFLVSETASATGGYTPGKLISAGTTNATSVKGTAGTLGYLTASNINASPRYLKIYNKATAPTVGTDVPVHTFLIPGNTAGTGTNIPIPAEGIALGTGIAFAITAGATDADATAVAVAEIIVNYGWI